MSEPTLLCPVCNQPATYIEARRHYDEIHPVEPLWPGGPLVALRDQLPQMRHRATTVVIGPCGDTIAWAAGDPPPTFQTAPGTQQPDREAQQPDRDVQQPEQENPNQ